MAKAVYSAEDKIVVGLAILSVCCCLRISEAASIRGVDLVQDEAYVQFYDYKTKDKWVKRPAGTYICRVIGFLRLQMAILGHNAQLPLFRGGSRKLGECMARLLRGTEFRDLQWHAWRRAGATMFIRAVGAWRSSWHGRGGSLSVWRGNMWHDGMTCHGRQAWYRGRGLSRGSSEVEIRPGAV